ncbi:NAD(P)/FAD-dependent oxidoreductase [Novosphingobium sp. TH158]|uniref:flavin-containing monooxygenase n=1 Tax=Novosphingobium sp. TH158 TaxID=2067455 RepID=UPI000C7DBFC9|nr:NAD(P)/FAD-dependent oxidoreductase [Novosphingobium sp. TH158]PLK24442.1 FAD-containing monooxygenase EthA [Novosphingobium sp. TH158]
MAASETFDMIIVGAGISGIGMAAKLAMHLPHKTYVMLDRREDLGGTWDLFRYPGIRSDSDMHTFAYAFAPWREENAFATAAEIKDYLGRVVAENGIAERMRFGQHVESADWDSGSGLWTVRARQADGSVKDYAARHLFMGTGYYDYDSPHEADIPGLSAFKGKVIHPQFWPEDYDYSGKKVVVVGSGATAVTIVPSMAGKAAHVTMLQRTPTWYGVRPWKDKWANLLKRWLPEKLAWKINREKAQYLHEYLFHKCRSEPEGVASFLHGVLKKELGPAWNAPDYTPPYKPWEQRMCLVPGGDMFQAIRRGDASVVTGRIARVVKDGIELEDGRKVEADVIVTATGLRLSTLGKVKVSVDGAPVDVAQHFWYRNCMLSNVPNLYVLFGYLNSGWTLRVDIVTDWLVKLLAHMDKWKVDVATPALADDHGLEEYQPFDLFSSGYLQRGKHLIPKSATTAPWRIHMFYREDKKELEEAEINDGLMRFDRVAGKAAA